MNMQITSKQKSTLFKEKVVVCKENFPDVHTDAVINFCSQSILSGPEFFEVIHNICGPELINECSQYMGMAPTSCRKTGAYKARNFQFIIHTLVPAPLHLTDQMDLRKVYMCVRNSLDMAVEEGAQIIAFPAYFPGIDIALGCEIILRIFVDWLHKSLAEIKVICPSDQQYCNYVDAAKNLYSLAHGNNYISPSMRPKNVIIPSRYYAFPEKNYMRGRRSRRCMDAPPLDIAPITLELSAKLAPTILVLDDINGMKRQYRLTNKSRDNRKLYFRCSRCDTLIKKDGRRIRAKLIVEDGQVVSERYPEHHPDCQPKSHEDVFLQQIDRSSRRDVKDFNLLPQEAYNKAVDRVRREAPLEQQVDVNKFPDWNHLRQQYCRIRKSAMCKRSRENDEDQMPMQMYNERAYKMSKYVDYMDEDMAIEYDDPNIQYQEDHMNLAEDQHLIHSNHLIQQHPQSSIKGENIQEDEDEDPIINVDDDLNMGSNIATVNASGHVSSGNGAMIHPHKLLKQGNNVQFSQENLIDGKGKLGSNANMQQGAPPLQHFMPTMDDEEDDVDEHGIIGNEEIDVKPTQDLKPL